MNFICYSRHEMSRFNRKVNDTYLYNNRKTANMQMVISDGRFNFSMVSGRKKVAL